MDRPVYLVTGATGLVGHHVLRELVARGHDPDQVIALDAAPREEDVEDLVGSVTLVRADITDVFALADAFARHRPTHVVHLAATIADRSWENPNLAVSVSIQGTNNVFESMRLFDVPVGVYASSVGVYGTADAFPWKPRPVTVDEEDPFATRNPYGASKVVNEAMAHTYAAKHGLALVGVRIGGVWGRGRDWGGAGSLNRFVTEAALGDEARIPATWVHFGDIVASYGKDAGRHLVDLCDRAHEDLPRRVYNQGARAPFTMADLCAAIHRVRPEVRLLDPDPGDQGDWVRSVAPPRVDTSRWYDELGFREEWPLERAVRDHVEGTRRRLDLPPPP